MAGKKKPWLAAAQVMPLSLELNAPPSLVPAKI
jgi:hypothetical protein